jgi:hypothetical protein
MMYENKAYDKKSYPKLVLSRLKLMGGLSLIYIPLGTWFKEVFIEVSMCAPITEASEKASMCAPTKVTS